MDVDSDTESVDREFPIFIKIIVARQYHTLVFTIKDSYKVMDITKLFQNRTQIPAQNIILYYQSRKLSPSQPISAYNIARDSTLEANVKNGPMSSSFSHSIYYIRNQVYQIIHKIRNIEREYYNDVRNDNINSIPKLYNLCNTYDLKIRQLLSEKLDLYRLWYQCYEYGIKSHNYIPKKILNYPELVEIESDAKRIEKKRRRNEVKIHEIEIIINKAQAAMNTASDDEKCQLNQRIQLVDKAKEFTKKLEIKERKMKMDMINYQIERTFNALYNKDGSYQSFFGTPNGKLRTFEGWYEKWSTDDVIAWIKLIESRKFNAGYDSFFDKIKICQIDGSKMMDLINDICLKLMGLNDDDIEVLSKNVKDLMMTNNEGKNKSICTMCIVDKIDTMILPCCHQTWCWKCCQESRMKFVQCPVCRVDIEEIVKAHMSGFLNDKQ